MRCSFAQCDYPAAYVMIRTRETGDVPEYVFSTCSAHGLVMDWDDPECRAKHGVLTADEFEVRQVQEA